MLDDFSRYVVAWKLCTTMRAEHVIDTLDLALAACGCDCPTVLHRPRLLSDNGSSYIADDLVTWLTGNFVDHENHRRVHDSLGNVTTTDAYFGGAPAILEERTRTKEQTIRQRRLLTQTCAA